MPSSPATNSQCASCSHRSRYGIRPPQGPAAAAQADQLLSQYKYQDGLGYYEMTKDTASHFYIDYLPKGVYVFEYSVRVQHKGQYQSGMANIQCLYAPEFSNPLPATSCR